MPCSASRGVHPVQRSFSLLAGAMVLALATPAPARAAGGIFARMDEPDASAVHQHVDAVLVLDDGMLEMHLRTRVHGTATDYAWVIPVPSPPEVFTGSTRLLDALDRASAPAFDVRGARSCPGIARPPSSGTPDPPAPASPPVVSRTLVGEHRVTVISPPDGDIDIWLSTHGYVRAADTTNVLQDHTTAGGSFVVLEYVSTGTEAETLPVRLRFPASIPRLPLALVPLTSADRIGVNVWVLGDAPAAPTGHRHVELDLLRVDWRNGGSHFPKLLADAVAEPFADNEAFVTVYAETTENVSRENLLDPSWNPVALAEASWTEVMDELQRQGLVTCAMGSGCRYHHEGVETALLEGFPPPSGVEPQLFYACPACYEGLFAEGLWHPIQLIEALRKRLIDPGRNAIELLDRWPVATRLQTVLRGGAMTTDPGFFFDPEAQLRPSRRWSELFERCDGDAVLSLDDGREVFLPQGTSWPSILSDLPAARAIQQLMPGAKALVLVDNTDRIEAALADHNAAHGWPRQGCRARVPGGPIPLTWAALLLVAIRRRRL